MTPGLVARLACVALLVMVLNIACTVAYMVLYGHVIDPGHEAQYYQDYVQVAAPYCGIIAGIPLMFLVGWWVTGWPSVRRSLMGGFVIWLIYFLVDLSILLTAGGATSVSSMVAVSFLTKLGAVCLGALARRQRFVADGQSALR